MKIIIACTSAGAGHIKAAEALYAYFQSRDPGLDIALIDVLEESDFLFRKTYSSGYSFMVNHAQWLWKILFYITAQRKLQPTIQKVRTMNNRARVRNFARDLVRTQPDIIIATHFLPAAIASYLKEAGKINARLLTVITDFGVHPFWVYDNTDLYAVASEHSRRKLIALGISADKILVTGIPVAEKFLKKFDRESLCRQLELDPDRFTILVVTGSFGIGPIEPIVGLLHRHAQILVVCARNKKLFERLGKKKYPSLRVYGFVDNIEELMAVSDCIITKPGGLSISELLSMEIPPIFISAIPGQETENVKILAGYGIGEIAGITTPLKKKLPRRVRRSYEEALVVKRKVMEYIKHPQKLKDIKDKIRKVKKPDAAQEIYRAVC